MNGRVAAVHVSPGAQVAKGQLLMVIEAMKMEHGVVASLAGRVEALSVSVGDQVAPGALLAEVVPAAAMAAG